MRGSVGAACPFAPLAGRRCRQADEGQSLPSNPPGLQTANLEDDDRGRLRRLGSRGIPGSIHQQYPPHQPARGVCLNAPRTYPLALPSKRRSNPRSACRPSALRSRG
ncbi:hypothetical protein CN226_06025 [Sinorhizobium meliloti]|nr:hypothetical protein CN226_06025 [Sinorhizobium meliloti]